MLLLLLSSPAFTATDLDRLKGLAGDWSFVDPGGDATVLRVTYQVVADGAAVMETLFTGTAEETVTLYHRDGNRVTVTQVSGRDAPVQLTPRNVRDPEKLRFEVDEEIVKPGRLRALELTLLDEARLRLVWLIASDETGTSPQAFELEREATVEALAAEVGRMRVDLETRTLPPGPGWNVSGVPMRHFLHDQVKTFASTYASEGDQGMTVAHYAFKAGPECRLRFSVLGGNGFIAVVEETRAPQRRIRSVPEFAIKLDGGEFGPIVEKIEGGRWADHPRSVEWDLSLFEGKQLRLYVVDAKSDHYGQIAISEVSILEKATR